MNKFTVLSWVRLMALWSCLALNHSTFAEAPKGLLCNLMSRPERSVITVELPDDKGQPLWALEDRPPTTFHRCNPVQILKQPDGSWFIDFEKAAFGRLLVTLDWTPEDSSTKDLTITVNLGEKSNGKTVDLETGGGIVACSLPLKIKPGKHEYELGLALPDGLISSRTGRETPEFLKSIHLSKTKLRDIVDWPTVETDGYVFQEVNTVVNAFHYRALVLMEKIAEATTHPEDARFYAQRAALVKEAFQKAFFDPQRGIYIDGIGTNHASLHANLFPLAFGLVPNEHQRTVVDFIKSRGMACSVYPTVYLLEALYDAGEDQYALDLLTSTETRSWMNLLRVGSTVTTEAWDIQYKNNCGWTHAWSTAPVHIIPRKLMGIEPLEPGFAKIRIQTRPGNLTYATMRLPTIRGTIETSFKSSGPNGEFELNLTIPTNMRAEIYFPVPGNDARVRIDGKSAQGKRMGKFVVIDEIGSGTHQLSNDFRADVGRTVEVSARDSGATPTLKGNISTAPCSHNGMTAHGIKYIDNNGLTDKIEFL